MYKLYPPPTEVDVYGVKVPEHVIRKMKNISLIDSLGAGNFGQVYRGYLDFDKSTRFEVAIKESKSEGAQEMLEEAKAMIRVTKHEHIVNFQGIVISEDQERVFLLLEFCANGPIESYLQKNYMLYYQQLQVKNYNKFLDWCSEIAAGMDFLASQDVIHVSLPKDSSQGCAVTFIKKTWSKVTKIS